MLLKNSNNTLLISFLTILLLTACKNCPNGHIIIINITFNFIQSLLKFIYAIVVESIFHKISILFSTIHLQSTAQLTLIIRQFIL